MLANFFNSLLSKKTGAPGSPGSGAVGAGVQGPAKKTGTTPFSSAFTSSPWKQPISRHTTSGVGSFTTT